MLSLSDFHDVLDKVFGCWNLQFTEEARKSSITDNMMYEYSRYVYYKGKRIALYHYNNDMKPEILVYDQKKDEPNYKPKYKFTLKRALIKANYTELHERDVLWEIYQKTTNLITKHYSSTYMDYIKVFVSMAKRWDDKWLVKLIEELNKVHEERVKPEEDTKLLSNEKY